jgi:hypothetical protein
VSKLHLIALLAIMAVFGLALGALFLWHIMAPWRPKPPSSRRRRGFDGPPFKAIHIVLFSISVVFAIVLATGIAWHLLGII